MTKPSLQIGLIAILALALGACASADGRYPSLAIRDAERAQGTLNPRPSTDDAVDGITDMDALLAPLDRAQEAHAEFTAQKDQVNALVLASRGIGPEDDRRARALVGLAALTSLRGQTALALADLDQLEVSAATEFKRTREIRDLQASIQQLIQQQDQTLDSLAEMLAQ
ncbi:MAG: hypothetical protein AAFY42_03425 [Pseudomonadota bacterium]